VRRAATCCAVLLIAASPLERLLPEGARRALVARFGSLDRITMTELKTVPRSNKPNELLACGSYDVQADVHGRYRPRSSEFAYFPSDNTFWTEDWMFDGIKLHLGPTPEDFRRDPDAALGESRMIGYGGSQALALCRRDDDHL